MTRTGWITLGAFALVVSAMLLLFLAPRLLVDWLFGPNWW